MGSTAATDTLSQQLLSERWPLPYYAIIFTSKRPAPAPTIEEFSSLSPSSPLTKRPSTTDASASSSATTTSPPTSASDDYAATAIALFDLVQTQPGYLGAESHHTVSADGSVRGVTVSYWRDMGSIAAWRAQSQHAEARRKGRETFYERWNVRVTKVEREYGNNGLEG